MSYINTYLKIKMTTNTATKIIQNTTKVMVAILHGDTRASTLSIARYVEAPVNVTMTLQELKINHIMSIIKGLGITKSQFNDQ